MRVVKINAQVTAMISFSEIVGFIIISIVSTLSITIGKILFPVLQNIILPCAFLMNTRDNKYRIVEHGWRNFLRDTLIVSYLCSVCQSSSRVESFENNKNKERDNVYVAPRYDRHIPLIVADSTLKNKSAVVESNLNVPFNEIPCVSNKRDENDDEQKNSRSIPSPLSSSSEESAEPEKLNLTYRKELLGKLLQHSNEEIVYLSNFTRLITFEQDHTVEESDLEEYIAMREGLIMNKVSKLLIKGKRRTRINKRQDLIKKLLTFLNDESNYQKTFNAFVNMEESFLED